MLENSMVLYTDEEFNDYWGDEEEILDDDFDDSIDNEDE